MPLFQAPFCAARKPNGKTIIVLKITIFTERKDTGYTPKQDVQL